VKNKYPKVNCEDTAAFYTDSQDSLNAWEKNALEEFFINKKAEDKNKPTHFGPDL